MGQAGQASPGLSPNHQTAREIDGMDNKPAAAAARDVDTLFQLGVVAAMSDEQLLS